MLGRGSSVLSASIPFFLYLVFSLAANGNTFCNQKVFKKFRGFLKPIQRCTSVFHREAHSPQNPWLFVSRKE
ncbi:hypothetical protein COY07_04995 [Candidatus Peregrinibacteria bacterium CG_4_10_14_0_2_um_filter_43_11]|nr:MAG: hypothetical protein COY07_04995 [Candidatus Peregrinibacteria bacterium CG_4_10_14_0_2_um_filter_43_11]